VRTVVVDGVERHMKGWRPDRPDPRDKFLSAPESIALPPIADLRTQCPPVVDQGNIGSCTANSSCSAMAFLERKAKQDILFSRLFLYAMTRHLEGTPLNEDSGAEIRDVMKSLSTYGVPYETEWPYVTSKFSIDPPAQVKTDALKHKAILYYRCPNLYSLKASLHQGFPVVIGFAVPDNMMSETTARTGIVLPPSPGESFDGGHAVLAVGYNVNMAIGNEHGAVLCQNSWGTDWGQAGYFTMPYEYIGDDNLADDFWTIRAFEGN